MSNETPNPLHAVEVPSADVAQGFQRAINQAMHDSYQEGYEQALKDLKAQVRVTPQTEAGIQHDGAA